MFKQEANECDVKNFCFRSEDLPRLVRRNVAGYHMYLSAGRAESLVAMESFVGLTVGVAQNLYLFHLAVVFFRGGKKLQQPRLEQLIRLGRFFEKFPAPRT
jgi:hypothetical protein